jgi:hypothetical protein
VWGEEEESITAKNYKLLLNALKYIFLASLEVTEFQTRDAYSNLGSNIFLTLSYSRPSVAG